MDCYLYRQLMAPSTLNEEMSYLDVSFPVSRSETGYTKSNTKIHIWNYKQNTAPVSKELSINNKKFFFI